MEKARRKFWIVILVMFAGILAVALGALWPRPKTEPDLSPLNHYLEGTAEKVIALSKLTDATVEVKVSPSELQAEIARIKDLATKCGGSAVADSDSQNGANLLAEIPAQLADRFVEAVRAKSRETPEKTPSPDGKMALVEVKLTLED
jgi:hypothetical protein